MAWSKTLARKEQSQKERPLPALPRPGHVLLLGKPWTVTSWTAGPGPLIFTSHGPSPHSLLLSGGVEIAGTP